MFEALIDELENFPWIISIIQIVLFFLAAWLVACLAKARFGKAAEMRPRLPALVQERLVEAEIVLIG
jgi:hypothetical protein